jgi:hypothetical protein
MRQITTLDERLLPIVNEEKQKREMPTRRVVLQMIGNVKSETADESRRTMRILNKLRDEKTSDLVLETDDLNFLLKLFEKNQMSLTAWCHGQMLDLIESAGKVDPLKVV